MDLVTTNDGLKAILELDDAEVKWWRGVIGQARKNNIPSPTSSVQKYFERYVDSNPDPINVSDISRLIQEVRRGVWTRFIQFEIRFFAEVIGELMKRRDTPKEILSSVITEEFVRKLTANQDRGQILDSLSDVFADFSGRIFPYFYELSKSQTNSRRSRAGSEFEAIIDHLMKRLNIPYDSQSHLGQRTFSEKGLGKKVDGVVPSMDAFNANRSRCIIATMKTTIRERWQEVVEELNRTNIPSIHLLTLDDGITSSTLGLMKNHNITLVTYREIKALHPTFTNIMDFETFFGSEIPHTLDWWENNGG